MTRKLRGGHTENFLSCCPLDFRWVGYFQYGCIRGEKEWISTGRVLRSTSMGGGDVTPESPWGNHGDILIPPIEPIEISAPKCCFGFD